MTTTAQAFEQIKRGMTLAFFASAYADQAEECGQPLRGEIMDQLPGTVDPAAIHAAETLISGMINAHNFAEPGLSQAQAIGALYLKVARCDRSGRDRECTPALFGHYCAMQAMGTGVGLESFGSAAHDAVTVPYVEFGAYSLERDYFEAEEDVETADREAQYRQYALGRLASDDLEFDEEAEVRLGDDAGAWVRAWVWVPESSL